MTGSINTNSRVGFETDADPKGKGKSRPQAETKKEEGISSSSMLGAISESAKNLASALDPRTQAPGRFHTGFGSEDPSTLFRSNHGSSSATGSKQQTAFASSASYQHATRALETVHGHTTSPSGSNSTSSAPSGFRSSSTSTPAATASSGSSGGSAGAGMVMDWDNFLSSSESTIPDDQPYQPPAFSSFSQPNSQPQPTRLFPSTAPTAHALGSGSLGAPAPAPAIGSVYQNHLSQPMNLTPANHAAFLEYLKSTASTTTAGQQVQSNHPHVSSTSFQSQPQLPSLPHPGSHSSSNYHPYAPYTPIGTTSSAQPLISHDVQLQHQRDGEDVLAFLNSTSYSDFVEELEAAGLEKYQHERRQFHYTEAMVSQRLFSTLSLIQHLPSERQDIVQYLLQQGTYTDDVYSQPYGWDERDESTSLAATRSEQDQFLQTQLQKQGGSSHLDGKDNAESKDGGATTAEMERVLAEIVADAKKEVSTGETQGKALNRLLMVRSHITMGTKL
ncbi:hypothetical protein BGZ94_003202 [Podila epigama]|nr:hypothetical protein BGZ94_003202 [Podila epigama]